MPAPSAYTESEFAAYLVDQVLGPVASELVWTAVSTPVSNAVDETLLALNSEDISEFNSILLIRKLRAFGRREIWRQAAQVTAAEINVSSDGTQAQLSQLHTQCKAMFAMEAASVEAEYGGNDGELDSEAATVVLRRRATAVDPYATRATLEEAWSGES